jgi:hypothetical protein
LSGLKAIPALARQISVRMTSLYAKKKKNEVTKPVCPNLPDPIQMQPGMSICCVVYSGGISDKEMK